MIITPRFHQVFCLKSREFLIPASVLLETDDVKFKSRKRVVKNIKSSKSESIENATRSWNKFEQSKDYKEWKPQIFTQFTRREKPRKASFVLFICKLISTSRIVTDIFNLRVVSFTSNSPIAWLSADCNLNQNINLLTSVTVYCSLLNCVT